MNKKLFCIIFSLCACTSFLAAHTHSHNSEFHFEHEHSGMEENPGTHAEFHFGPGPG